MLAGVASSGPAAAAGEAHALRANQSLLRPREGAAEAGGLPEEAETWQEPEGAVQSGGGDAGRHCAPRRQGRCVPGQVASNAVCVVGSWEIEMRLLAFNGLNSSRKKKKYFSQRISLNI